MVTPSRIPFAPSAGRKERRSSFGAQQLVTTAADSPFSLFLADLTKSGDLDVISASADDDEVAWYQNDGGGGFTTPPLLSSTAVFATSVFAADLDGDGDQDVLSASAGDDTIAWYRRGELISGATTFGPALTITTLADGATSVFAADLDGDGDVDVLSSSITDDEIAWYENTDGAGSFGPQQIISSAVDGARAVIASDLDGDGDRDAAAANANDDEIVRYRHDGLDAKNGGIFFSGAQVITDLADGASRSMRSTSITMATPTSSPPRSSTTRSAGTRTSTSPTRSTRTATVTACSTASK